MVNACHRKKLILFLVAILFTVSVAAVSTNESDYIVKGLRVEDMPNDGGDGLRLVWKPIKPIGEDGLPHPENAGIIEYRIYRGVSPDSLYFLAKKAVNVKTGVVADSMVYFDSGFAPFVSVESPMFLRKESGAPEGSNLYGAMPRDLDVTGKMFNHFNVFSRIEHKKLYFETKKVTIDDVAYAGYQIYQANLYSQLKAGSTYYYTVVAVSQSRHFYPVTKPVAGIPRANIPGAPDACNAAYIKDVDKLQIEWGGNGNVFFILKNEDTEKFNQYVEYTNKVNEQVYNQQTFGTEPVAIEEVEAPLQMFAQGFGGRTSVEDFAKNNFADAIFDEATIDNYRVVVGYFAGPYKTFSEPVKFEGVFRSAELPKVPALTITDKPNDKGDINLAYWGKPSVNLTKITFVHDHKLMVAYEYSDNAAYRINHIYFRIKDKTGKEVGFYDEFYLDGTFKIAFDDNVNIKDGLDFEITLKAGGKMLEEDIYFQSIEYSDVTLSMIPESLYYGKQRKRLADWKYSLERKSIMGRSYRETGKLAGTDAGYEDTSSYDKYFFRPVKKYKGDLMLTEPVVDVGFDEKTGTVIQTTIFKDEYEKYMKKQADEIAKMPETTEREKAAKKQAQTEYDTTKNYKPLIEANKKGNSARIKYLAKNYNNIRRAYSYRLVKTNNKGLFTIGKPIEKDGKVAYFLPKPNWLQLDRIPMMVATVVFGFLVWLMIKLAKSGRDLYIRPIAGIQEIDNAIGRATEMGRPILFQPGLSGISDVATLAGLSILGRVAKKAAEYDTRILVPVRDYIVLPIAQEIVREAHYEAGRPDTYDRNSAFFITTSQFAFVAGVNGVMIREKTATNFYMGMFWAESLIMTETGNATGAIQISGTDSISQLPFFIATCDYTLIGEELYAASAYLAREPLTVGALKAQDYFKFLIVFFVVLGTLLSTAKITFLINIFPDK